MSEGFVVLVPARLASTRLPDKPLADIAGLPMVVRVAQQAAKSRARTNRVIFIDGIFSTLSNRKIIGEALNGLRDLGGNFQVIGFLHSPTWVNDPSVFPVYHVGKKLGKANGDSLVSFREEGRASGTLGFLTVIAQPAANSDLAA